jgi:hypothetical protein
MLKFLAWPSVAPQKPEYDLRFEEGSLIGIRRITAFEKIRDLADAGTAFGFVFARWRDGERLTAILLRQAQKAAVTRPGAIEALDREHAPSGEVHDLRLGDGQAQGGNEFKA